MATRVEVTLKDGTVKVAQLPDNITPDAAQQVLKKQLGEGMIARLRKLPPTESPFPAAPAGAGPIPTSATSTISEQRKSAPVNLGEEALAVGDKTLRGGLLALPRLTQTISNFAAEHSDRSNPTLVTSALNKLFGKPKPSADRILKMQKVQEVVENPVETIENLTGGPIRQPKTRAGKMIGNVGESTVAALTGPGGLVQPVRNAIIGASAGVGGEVGGMIDEENPLLRAGGSLLGGGLASVGTSLVPNAKTLIKQSTKAIPEADWKAARELEATLDDSAISHLKSQLLGPSSTLDDLVAQAASHPEIRPLLINAVKDSPEEARKAVYAWMDSQLPIVVNDSRRKLLSDIQEAATSAEKGILSKSNSAYAAELADDVSYELYSLPTINAMRRDLRMLVRDPNYYGPQSTGGKSIRKFLSDVLVAPKKNSKGQLVGVPKGYINNIYKDLGKLKRGDDAYKNLPVDDIKKVLQRYTDQDFGAARAAKGGVMSSELQPFQKGLAGQIARMGGGIKPDKHTASEQAINIVFPKNSPQVPEIRELGKQMGPDTVGVLLREHLSRRLEDAITVQRNQSATVTTPFSFSKVVFGNNAQKRNIEAAIEVIAKGNKIDPGAAQAGFRKMMRTLDSFKDLRIPPSIDRGELAEQAGENIAGKLATPNVSFRRFRQSMVTEKTYREIARLVTSKDGLRELEKIAKSPDPKAMQVFLRSVIAAGSDEE